jgi:ureidoacrylate peracid hydrolase
MRGGSVSDLEGLDPTVPDVESALVPSRAVLLIVDIQNDFCHQQGGLGRAGIPMDAIQAAVGRLPRLIEAARQAGVPVIFVKTQHGRWDTSPVWRTPTIRKSSGELCAPNSWGAEFFRIRPSPDDCVIVKHRYSAFVGTDLEVVLRSLARSTLVLAGVTTNVCVESTARDAFMRDYHVVLVRDCTAALTREEHDAAVRNIGTYFGRVVTSEAVTASWNRPVQATVEGGRSGWPREDPVRLEPSAG